MSSKYNNFLTPNESAAEPLPSADVTGRFVGDQRIRDCGYAIKSRAHGKQATWVKDGIEFSQAEVIAREMLDKQKGN